MKKLIAKRPILYLARQYRAGDLLPANDPEMIKLWLQAKSAAWEDEEPSETEQQPLRARMATAQPGMFGISSTGNEDDLVGRIPKTPERQRPKTRKRKNQT